MITVELYGVPRLRAGADVIQIDAATIGQALAELRRLSPGLAGSILANGTLAESVLLSLNGARFVTDPAQPLSDGDVILLVSADVGG